MPTSILESFNEMAENSDTLKNVIHFEEKSKECLLEKKFDDENNKIFRTDSNSKNILSESNVLVCATISDENLDESSILLSKNKLSANEDSPIKLQKEHYSGGSDTKFDADVLINPLNQVPSVAKVDLPPKVDSPLKFQKKKINCSIDEESCVLNNSNEKLEDIKTDPSFIEIKDSNCSEEIDSSLKLNRKLAINCLEDDEICEDKAKLDVSPSNNELATDIDSPIKLKRKKVRNFLEEDDSGKIEPDSTVMLPSANNEQTLETDSPIKLTKKKFRSILDEEDSNSVNSAVFLPSTNNDPSLETDSPIKVTKKKFKNLLDEEDSNSVSDDCINANLNSTNEMDLNSISERNKTKTYISQEEKNKIDYDDLYDNEENIEDVCQDEKSKADKIDDLFDNEENLENEDSDCNSESSLNKKAENFLSREVKGKDLIRQSLSLPYFQLPKPDFQKYIKETDECLEKPLMTEKNNSSENFKQPKKITLKPTNTIVFEVGSSSMNKVMRFQKKVLNMMSCVGSSEDADKVGGGHKKAAAAPIGAERLSWKMKLLSDIAKKKEAVLKERNEMLEEVMENGEEEYIMESDNEDVVEEDKVDIHFPVIDPMNSRSETDTMEQNFGEISKGISHDDSHSMFGGTNKDWESDKEIESSPFCFSLPSFQPEGGFSKSVNVSSSSDFVSEANLSLVREDESGKDVLESSRIENSNINDVHPLVSMSEGNEKIYGEVLTEEKLLINRSIQGEMSADILDMCSGQFMDTVETPKTPPLTNISADEESDVDVSEDIFNKDSHIEAISDSDSDDELTFKKKVVNKRIRPISPIDEESRHGEEDTQVHPASVSVDTNSNFNFGKKSSDLCNADNSALAQDDSNDSIDHEDSLVGDEEVVSKQESKKTLLAREYFEDEAELSGEEGSSDEDEGELDGEDPLIFDDEELPANDEIRDQIGTLHLKHLLDDDDQMIREVKNHFLDEGDLYSDAARQRKFNWSFNPTEPGVNPDLSGSENEEEVTDSPFQQDKLKWKQENADNEISEVMETQTLQASFKIEVQKKISTHIVAQQTIKTFNKRPRNSFLDEEEAKKSLKKIKLDMITGQGTRATKNFVFVESGGPTKRKISSHKNSIDTSVFDVI